MNCGSKLGINEQKEADKRSKTQVFISFSMKDENIANKIYEQLTKNGIGSWISTKSMDPGKDYPTQIIRAIDNCDIFVMVITENTYESRHVQTEIERAFSGNKEIYPIKLDNSDMPESFAYFLGRTQWFTPDDMDEFEWIAKLVDNITNLIGTQNKGNSKAK
jgi:predicted lactoylglutathione lyase